VDESENVAGHAEGDGDREQSDNKQHEGRKHAGAAAPAQSGTEGQQIDRHRYQEKRRDRVAERQQRQVGRHRHA